MITILLAAGSGTRMGRLTDARPKALVEVGGRPILDRNVQAIAAADPGGTILVVAGHRAEAIFAFVEAAGADVRAVLNPDHASAGPLRSIQIALASLGAQPGALAIGNGDTVFTAPAIEALLAAEADAALLISEPEERDPDDVQVRIGADGRIVEAAKRIDEAGALPISAGLFRVTAERLGPVVDALLGEERGAGRAFTWHTVVGRLAAEGLAIAPARVPHRWWWEFDSEEHVARFGESGAL